jgi:hypothetical protein
VANFTERISVIVDAKFDQATAGFKKFSADVRAAEGAAGKFKAGWSNAAAGVKQNAGMIATTAGAALVAFGVKAVGAFTDVAKASVDMSKATGLSVEEASRWIAVGDDYEVTAEQLAGAMGRIGKSLDSAKWDKYGIATRDAAGNARDANDIFIDVLTTISNTKPAEQARVGAELLGKGWQGIAPILGKTRDEYEDMLSTVEDGQVITDSEAKKAEKMRLTQDKLADAFGEVTLAAGELIAGAEPVIDLFADLVSGAAKLAKGLSWVRSEMETMLDNGAFGSAADNIKEVEVAMESLAGRLDKVAAATEATTLAQESAQRSGEALTEVLEGQRDAASDAAASMYDLETATIMTDQAYADYLVSLQEANAAAADSNVTDAERVRILQDLRLEQIGVVEGLGDEAEKFAESQGAADGSNASLNLQIGYLVDMKAKYPLLAAEIQKYIDKLNAIPGAKHTNVSVAYSSSGASNGGMRQYASGTSSAAPGVALVGEQGPELVVMGGGERVLTAAQTARAASTGGLGGNTFYLTVNAGIGTDGAAVGRQILGLLQQAQNDGATGPWMR